MHRWTTAKSQNLALDRGLYIIRYESADSEGAPPIVRVTSEPGANEVICHPDGNPAELNGPGTALVVLSQYASSIRVDVAPLLAGGSTSCSVKVEPITNDARSLDEAPDADTAPPPFTPPAFQRETPHTYTADYPATRASSIEQPPLASDSDIIVVGHLSRRGDVAVAADEWLGGPFAPTQIEGLRIEWPGAPQGVSLRYSAIGAGQNPHATRMVDAGDFVGTRGEARPLIGVRFELQGRNAGLFELQVEALFLGQTAERDEGTDLSFSGPSGREPLIGLRLALRKREGGPAYAEPRSKRERSGGKSAPIDKSRVRLF